LNDDAVLNAKQFSDSGISWFWYFMV